MTFDAFCAYLAGKTPIMSGLGGGKTVEDPALIYRSAILDTLGSVNSRMISLKSSVTRWKQCSPSPATVSNCWC